MSERTKKGRDVIVEAHVVFLLRTWGGFVKMKE
jgi:hypothetical protein